MHASPIFKDSPSYPKIGEFFITFNLYITANNGRESTPFQYHGEH